MLVARRIAVPVGLTRFGDRPDTYSVVVKQTYDISAAGPARLLPDQDRLQGDEYDERETRIYPSDFSPLKLTCDVLVVGEALAHEEGEAALVQAAAMSKRADCAALLGPLPADATDPFGQDAPMDQRLPWPPLPLQVSVAAFGRTLDAILPGPVPEAALVYGGAFTEAVSLPLHIDGVQLDPIRATCALTFRGSFQHAGSVHRDVLLVVDVLGRLAFATIEEVEGWARSPVEMDPSALADASLVIGEPAVTLDAELTPIGEEASLSGGENESEDESDGVIEVEAGELEIEEEEEEEEEEEQDAPDSRETGVFARPVLADEPSEPDGDTDVGDDPMSLPVGTGTLSMRAIGTVPPPPLTGAAVAAPPLRPRGPLPTLPLEDDAAPVAARPPTRPPAAPTTPALPFMRSYGVPVLPGAPAAWPHAGVDADGKRALMVIGMHGTPLGVRPPTPVPVSSGPGFDNALPFTPGVPMAPLSQREVLRDDRPRQTDTVPPPAAQEVSPRQRQTEPPPTAIDAFDGFDLHPAPATVPPPPMASYVASAPPGTAPPPALSGMPLPFIPRAAGLPGHQAASAFMQGSSTSEPSTESVLGVKRVEGISIEEFASVRVALWSNAENRHDVLRRMGLSELRWRVVMRKWSEELSTMRVRPAELAAVIDHVRRAARKSES